MFSIFKANVFFLLQHPLSFSACPFSPLCPPFFPFNFTPFIIPLTSFFCQTASYPFLPSFLPCFLSFVFRFTNESGVHLSHRWNWPSNPPHSFFLSLAFSVFIYSLCSSFHHSFLHDSSLHLVFPSLNIHLFSCQLAKASHYWQRDILPSQQNPTTTTLGTPSVEPRPAPWDM